LEECWPCPVFANYTLAFALQLREKYGRTSVREPKRFKVYTLSRHPHTTKPTQTHTHILQNSLKPPQYKLKQTQYEIYPNEIIRILTLNIVALKKYPSTRRMFMNSSA
jgi:hypothetical protein